MLSRIHTVQTLLVLGVMKENMIIKGYSPEKLFFFFWDTSTKNRTKDCEIRKRNSRNLLYVVEL